MSITYIRDETEDQVVDHPRSCHPLGRVDHAALAQFHKDGDNDDKKHDRNTQKDCENPLGVRLHKPQQRSEAEVGSSADGRHEEGR